MMSEGHPPTAEPAPRRVGELIGIQYLRGIAALMVVVFHLGPQFARMGYTDTWLPGLSGGVDIFFVISGFIMWVTTYGRPITPVAFWKKRITRIVPLYWLFTAFMVAVMTITPHLLQTSRFGAIHIIASFMFVAAHHPGNGTMEPVVMPGWTLNYEMFFYLIFGLCLLLPLRARFVTTVVALLTLVTIGILADVDRVSIAGFYTSGIMIEFALGMTLGLILTGGDGFSRVKPSWGWMILIIGFAALVLMPSSILEPRLLIRGVPATAAVAGVLILEAHGRVREWRLPHVLGDCSYSVYLSHVVVLSASSQAWRKLHLEQLPGGLALYGLVAVVSSAVVGYFVYLWVEKPIIWLLRSREQAGVKIRTT